jgi:hypothetical protein
VVAYVTSVIRRTEEDAYVLSFLHDILSFHANMHTEIWHLLKLSVIIRLLEYCQTDRFEHEVGS